MGEGHASARLQVIEPKKTGARSAAKTTLVLIGPSHKIKWCIPGIRLLRLHCLFYHVPAYSNFEFLAGNNFHVSCGLKNLGTNISCNKDAKRIRNLFIL
jgi:hypothetical protein